MQHKEVEIESFSFDEEEDMPTGISSLDYILGGGLLKGSLTEIVSDSGLGKSTICLQVANNICSSGNKLTFVSMSP